MARRFRLPDHLLEYNPGLKDILGGKASVELQSESGLFIRGRRLRSKLEARAWQEWVLPYPGVIWAGYETISFNLPGGRYTPDFVMLVERGGKREIWFIEVKGSWHAYKSGRASKRAIREAAVELGWLGRFFVLTRSGGEWKLEALDLSRHNP